MSIIYELKLYYIIFDNMINFNCFYINYLSYKNLKYEKIYYCFLKLFNIGYILLSASCNSVLFFAPKKLIYINI